MIDTARDHLETGLEADDPAETDFHIRQALQLLVAVDETEATDGAGEAGPDTECPSCSGVIDSVTVTGPSTAIVSPCGCTVPPDLLPELGSGDGDAE